MAPSSNTGARVLVLAGVLGLLAVAAGAFGAHGLRTRVSPSDLEIWRTAAHYHLVHAGLLAIFGLALQRAPTRALRLGAVLSTIGIAVFSGTLYAMVLGGPRMLGAITPLGGLGLMGSWLCLAAHGVQHLRHGADDAG
jgi:uncharacterized membrane protein YgdD (TMEM256/DUF423 family)